MNVLQRGSKGDEVQAWQLFLRGQGLYMGKVDGDFGPKTEEATLAFQRAESDHVTGVVDHDTLAAAMLNGFEVLSDDRVDVSGPNWPAAPADLKPLSQDGRQSVFGKFNFKATPATNNPEAISVDAEWVRDSIVRVTLPAFGRLDARQVPFHRAGAEKLTALFEAWQADRVLDYVLSWDGSYAPRFIRGSRTVLSAHAWGSAFDINARWNALGTMPALLGKKGCVRELVARANELGFYWGGHFPGRKDGMHFELVRL